MRSIHRAVLGIAFLSLAFAAGAHAQPCNLPLLGMGPISPVHGFPQYYVDSSNLGLQPCLDLVCDPALAVPNPTAPISFPGNFPVETFYHRAISKLSGPNGVTAILTLALEGSFANGSVAQAGDQVVFTRVRVRVSPLTPGRIYTIRHPYGVETLQASDAAAAIPGVINFTRDSPRVPARFGAALAFSFPLTADVGPFLRFATGATPPPAGSIGNPAAAQTITGSPCGQNFFSLEGPFSDVAGISVRVQDGLRLDYTVSWSPRSCVDSGPMVRCRNGSGRLRGSFWQLPSGPGQYGFYISFSRVDLRGMLQGPVTVDIMHGDSIDRVGTLDACAPSTPALMVQCRARSSDR